MALSKEIKVILYLLIVLIVGFVGFWMLIIAIFAGIGKFYAPVILITSIILLVLILLGMFRLMASKKLKMLWISFLSLLFVSCGIHEIRNAYDRSFLRIRDSVDLSLYAPFADNTLAVSLEETSTLKLESDLPLLDGATALYPLYAAFAQAVYPEKGYTPHNGEVVCRNTVSAYERLINKEVDIIFVAPPSKQQAEAAEKEGVTFRFTPIGKEAFVFFVNARNPVENLSVEQVQAIYSGEITNWKEVGGNDESIRSFQRNENSGSQTAFLNFMDGKKIMDPPKEDVIAGMGGIISQTADYANYSNAIGFSFRFYANEMVSNNDIKLLRINDVHPDIETINNSSYPLSSQFYAISLVDNNKANVLKLLDWITSAQGQSLVEKTGYCPVCSFICLN